MRLLELEEQTQSLKSKVNILPTGTGGMLGLCAHGSMGAWDLEGILYCKGFVRLIHALYRCLPSLGCKNAWRS